MSLSYLESLKIKAKLLQKAKMKAGHPIQFKQALQTIAKLAGFPSWQKLKEVVEGTEIFCPHGSGAYWKTWYSSYEEALQHLSSQPGVYLLPYRKHFFVCDADYIQWLGISPDDADLAKVGKNWLEPQDREAWAAVLKKLKNRQR